MVKQFIRFCITGTISAAIDFTVYLSLTRLFDFWSKHLVTTTILAFIIANTNSYFMNKYWTFEQGMGSHAIQYPKFILVSIVGLVINAAFFFSFVHILKFNDIISKIIVAAIILCWNFVANKFWTFIHKPIPKLA